MRRRRGETGGVDGPAGGAINQSAECLVQSTRHFALRAIRPPVYALCLSERSHVTSPTVHAVPQEREEPANDVPDYERYDDQPDRQRQAERTNRIGWLDEMEAEDPVDGELG